MKLNASPDSGNRCNATCQAPAAVSANVMPTMLMHINQKLNSSTFCALTELPCGRPLSIGMA